MSDYFPFLRKGMFADCDGRNYVFHAFAISSPGSSCSLAARYSDDMHCSTLSAGADFSEGVIAKTSLQQPDVIFCHQSLNPPSPLKRWRHLWTAPNVPDTNWPQTNRQIKTEIAIRRRINKPEPKNPMLHLWNQIMMKICNKESYYLVQILVNVLVRVDEYICKEWYQR